MQIPHQLPQFFNQNALIVVMGSQRGLLYLASDGRIDIIGTVEQPPARYTDREGYFLNSGGGLVYASGAVYEDNNVERIRRFFKKVAHEVLRVIEAHEITHTYVFEPPYAKGAVTMALRPIVLRDVELVRYGNYLHAPATVLLKYIQTSTEPAHDPADPDSVAAEENAAEKRKILENAARAQAVIGKY